jgi:hypothetical protein
MSTELFTQGKSLLATLKGKPGMAVYRGKSNNINDFGGFPSEARFRPHSRAAL